jgi:hypothetical protein
MESTTYTSRQNHRGVTRLVLDEMCNISCETSGAGDSDPYHCDACMVFVSEVEVSILSARVPS